jgi:hypothetical protein
VLFFCSTQQETETNREERRRNQERIKITGRQAGNRKGKNGENKNDRPGGGGRGRGEGEEEQQQTTAERGEVGWESKFNGLS